jgi:hypothetical protein
MSPLLGLFGQPLLDNGHADARMPPLGGAASAFVTGAAR